MDKRGLRGDDWATAAGPYGGTVFNLPALRARGVLRVDTPAQEVPYRARARTHTHTHTQTHTNKHRHKHTKQASKQASKHAKTRAHRQRHRLTRARARARTRAHKDWPWRPWRRRRRRKLRAAKTPHGKNSARQKHRALFTAVAVSASNQHSLHAGWRGGEGVLHRTVHTSARFDALVC